MSDLGSIESSADADFVDERDPSAGAGARRARLTMPARRAYRTCTICEAGCGLVIDVDDAERITAVRGDRDDPLSAGYVCPKSQAMAGVAADPDLLRTPMLRVGKRWTEIGWAEALDRAAAGLAAVREVHGADAVATYAGNPVSNNTGALLYSGALIGALGTRQNFTAASIDAYPKLLANLLMFGDTGLNPVPDIDRTDLLVVIGANPVVSNGSIWTLPGLPNRLKALRARGGRLVVVDPRRTETAAIADDHLAIRSSADALLLLAMADTFFAEGLVSIGPLEGVVSGLDSLRELVAAFPPERVAEPTGIEAGRIRDLARAIASARSAAIYGRVGISCQPFGSLCCWLIEVLNLLSGNLDREGGLVVGRPVIEAPLSSRYAGARAPHGRFATTVRGLPELGGRLPAVAMAEEIESGSVRALVTIAGNPARSLPNSRRFARSLAALDFRLAIDFYLNETTRHADLILPPLDAVYRSNVTLFFGPYNPNSYARYSAPVLQRPVGGMADWEIMAALGARLANRDAADFSRAYVRGFVERALARRPDVTLSADEVLTRLEGREGPEQLCDLFLRLGEFGDGFDPGSQRLNLARLADLPHGVDFGPVGGGRLAGLLKTPDRMINAAPAAITCDLGRLEQWLADGRFQPASNDVSSFRLNGRRDLRSMNSWIHNLPNLAKGPERSGLLLHPSDAAALGIADGDRVVLEAGGEAIETRAVFSDAVRRGELCLPHGWGHDDPQARLAVARLRPGADFNALTPDAVIDEPSANAVFNGVPVRLRAADAPAFQTA